MERIWSLCPLTEKGGKNENDKIASVRTAPIQPKMIILHIPIHEFSGFERVVLAAICKFKYIGKKQITWIS